MGVKQEEIVRPYRFAAAFERAVVVLACVSTDFYGRVGYELDPKALELDVNRLALEAAQAVARDLGHGPGSSLIVVQRLARWRSDGKVTQEQVLDVDELLEAGEGARHDPKVFAAELIPILRQRVRDAATRALIDASAKDDDLEVAKVEAELTRARTLGVVDTDVGTYVSAASFDEIEAARHMDRLAFGIPELDTLLEGGVPRGTLTVAMGDQKSGKSMFCSHTVANAMLRRQFVMYATLEVPRPAVLARIKANLTGIPINALLYKDTTEARAIMERLRPQMGPCYVKKFPAKHTKVLDLKAWVADAQQRVGRKVDVLVVDYLDKCRAVSKAKKGGESDGLYQSMSDVYEDTRCWAEEEGFWALSPTQSQGRSGGRGKHKGFGGGGTTRDILDMGDEADSVEKSRIADLFLTLNPRDEGRSILFYVAGYRHGECRRATNPIPVDLSVGRIAPVSTQAAAGDDW